MDYLHRYFRRVGTETACEEPMDGGPEREVEWVTYECKLCDGDYWDEESGVCRLTIESPQEQELRNPAKEHVQEKHSGELR